MPLDPRICCAADVCCAPTEGRAARIEILMDAGLTREQAEKLADNLQEMGVTFAPESVMAAMREMFATHQKRESTRQGHDTHDTHDGHDTGTREHGVQR